MALIISILLFSFETFSLKLLAAQSAAKLRAIKVECLKRLLLLADLQHFKGDFLKVFLNKSCSLLLPSNRIFQAFYFYSSLQLETIYCLSFIQKKAAPLRYVMPSLSTSTLIENVYEGNLPLSSNFITRRRLRKQCLFKNFCIW